MKYKVFFIGMLALTGILGVGKYANLTTEAQERIPDVGTRLPNYDIRRDKSLEAADNLLKFRQAANKDAAAVANARSGFVAGEESLKQKVPNVKVEYNTDLQIPEIISPDINKEIGFLTAKSAVGNTEVLRQFIKENDGLFGVIAAQADQLELTADYKNPEDDLSFVHFKQKINGVPVFRGEVKAGFAKDGEMIRVINNLAPGLSYESVSTDFRSPAEAVRAAFRNVSRQMKPEDVQINAAESTDLKSKFGEGDWATTAAKIYFPTEPGIARAAWRVTVWDATDVYMVIVDAETGTMLWRKNATEEQTQSAFYDVYDNPFAMINVARSPAPKSPGPINPNTATQGSPRISALVKRIGNEAPYTFNNLGWITDGNNSTDGNAVEAGLDRSSPNGVDAPMVGNGFRNFSSSWNPPTGTANQGDDPLLPQAQRGAVIQMFYVMNLYHDELYRLGFTEAAGNFQNNNFGRGGAGNDRISAEAQDMTPDFGCPNPQQKPCLNNANFATVPDGGRGRMQMYLWDGPTPDRDGAADAEIMIHEATHGTSNRLIGDADGLDTNMSRGLGEGWSDFFALAMLSHPVEPTNGVYSMGGYVTHQAQTGFNSNFYYGIRRFPYAVKNFTGPNGLPHNPLTFRYLNTNCNTLIGSQFISPNSAHPRNPVFGQSHTVNGNPIPCDQVHRAGEIWASALWEIRGKFVARLGWKEGNRRILKIVTEAMKFSPLNPTFLQARDAVIVAAKFNGELADVADAWEGFRLRGMGANASIQNIGEDDNTDAAVTENFDAPQILVNPSPAAFNFTATAGGANPANGFLSISSPAAFTITTTMSDNASWLTVNQSSIISSAANILVDISGLNPGTHNANITVVVPGATNSPLNIPVTLTVKPEPFAVNPASLSFTSNAGGGNVPNQTFNIQNSGSQPLDFTVTDNAGWLNVSQTSGNLPGGANRLLIVSVNPAGLSGGTHSGKITITGGGITKEITVTLTVNLNSPIITVDPAAGLGFSADQGGQNPARQRLTITNSGGGTLKWTATADAGWLSVTPVTANVPSGENVSASVSVNISGLAAGIYNATITLTAPGAASKHVPVQLEIF